MEALIPTSTLYIKNLNDKLKTEALKKQLHMLFSQHGRVTQIVACKGPKLRGQAWVAFQDSTTATSAMRSKQGFTFFGKPLVIQFAKAREQEVASKAGGSNKRKLEKDVFASVPLVPGNAPNSILFAQNLPPEASQQALSMLFGQSSGFVEVRMAPGARGIAFLEFEDDVTATMALKQLNGFQLSATHVLQLAYSSS